MAKNGISNEGCLSIPSIREDVSRLSKVRIRYQDQDFNTIEEEYDGTKARIIQHEYTISKVLYRLSKCHKETPFET